MSTKSKGPDTGASTTEWEEQVFSQFSEQIKAFIGEKTHSIITADFSTTTINSKTASEIMLMAAMQKYFSDCMSTRCGIPNVTLLGKEDDWIAIREKAEALGGLMTKKFSKYWMNVLLPVLDKFVEASQGKIHHGFWQSMVKFRNTGGGSGSYPFISGWIQILFPYLCDDSVNTKLRQWNEMYFFGPRPERIPAILSSVPVDWDYRGTTFDIHFHAGFAGFSQDDRGGLMPSIGWFVTHDPPMPPEAEIKKIQQEIKDIWLGYKDEYNIEKKQIDKLADFFVRLEHLEKREGELLKKVNAVSKAKAIENMNERKCNTTDF